jgi:hypothetical protein
MYGAPAGARRERLRVLTGHTHKRLWLAARWIRDHVITPISMLHRAAFLCSEQSIQLYSATAVWQPLGLQPTVSKE